MARRAPASPLRTAMLFAQSGGWRPRIQSAAASAARLILAPYRLFLCASTVNSKTRQCGRERKSGEFRYRLPVAELAEVSILAASWLPELVTCATSLVDGRFEERPGLRRVGLQGGAGPAGVEVREAGQNRPAADVGAPVLQQEGRRGFVGTQRQERQGGRLELCVADATR